MDPSDSAGISDPQIDPSDPLPMEEAGISDPQIDPSDPLPMEEDAGTSDPQMGQKSTAVIATALPPQNVSLFVHGSSSAPVVPTTAATIARAGSFGPPRSHLLCKEQLTGLHVLAPSGKTGRGNKLNQNQQF